MELLLPMTPLVPALSLSIVVRSLLVVSTLHNACILNINIQKRKPAHLSASAFLGLFGCLGTINGPYPPALFNV